MNEKPFFPSSYNPYDGPNEHPEAELPLVAGKYLYVYGNMDDDGFYEGESYTTHIEHLKRSVRRYVLLAW